LDKRSKKKNAETGNILTILTEQMRCFLGWVFHISHDNLKYIYLFFY